MKTTLTASLAIALTCAAPAWADGAGINVELESLADQVSPAVVALDAQVQRGRLRGAPNVWDFQARPSGFFIDAEGHLLTDASFVGDDTQTLGLRLIGGLRARARVLGVDRLNNVALLALEDAGAVAQRLGGSLPFLELGTSSDLSPGQTVFSCGNTFDSVTVDGVPSFSRGIVASIGRLREDGAYRGVVIETDACVNPGTFGGPLFDRDGRVVGVVARQFSTRRWLGTAIPIDQVRLGVDAIKAGQTIRPGMLGVAIESRGGEASADGLRITRVQPNSAAASAGLRVGDRLLALDGRRVRDTGDIADELGQLPAGSPVRVRIARDGGEHVLVATLGMASGEVVAQVPPQPEQPAAAAGQGASLGVQVQQRAGARGLQILELRNPGPCHAAGLQPGDVLMSLGDSSLDTYADLERALARMRPGQQVALKVEREGWLREFKVTLGGSAVAQSPSTTQPRERGFMGVYLNPEGQGGAHVEGAQEGSAAAAAGLVKGDVIVKADGRRILKATDFVEVLETKFAGDALALQIRKADGSLKIVTATLMARGEQAQPAQPEPSPTARPWLGVALNVKDGRLVVDEVAPGSPCAQAGIQAGDVIVKAAGTPLTSLDQLAAILSKYRVGQALPLFVERDGWEKDFQIKLEAKR